MATIPAYIKGKYLLSKSKLPFAKKSAILEFFKNELIRKYRSQIFVMGNRLVFRNRSIAKSGFGKGEIKVIEHDDKVAILYSLDMKYAFFLSLAVSLITFAAILFLTAADSYMIPTIGALCVGLLFFCMVHFFTFLTFTLFMRREVQRLQEFSHKLAA